MTARPLPGERDRNVALTGADGGRWVLKVSRAEDAPAVALQIAALTWLGRRDPGLPVPRLHPALAGNPEGVRWRPGPQAGECVAWVCSLLPGNAVGQAPAGPGLRRDIGRRLGALDVALDGFDHPHAVRELAWDSGRARRVRWMAEALADPHLPLAALDHAHAHLWPELETLPAQVIHNDGNPQNLLASGGRLSGIIDFGDILRGPAVQDLATAAAYHCDAAEDPLLGPADLLAGYHEVRPVTEREAALLYDLMVSRLVLVVSIARWRASRQPWNSAYLLRNNTVAWRSLRRLWEAGCARAADRFVDMVRSPR